MRKRSGTIGKVLVLLLAIYALTFGAQELMASDAARECMILPPHELGECSSQTQCESMCEIASPGSQAICDQNGCCACLQ